MNELVATYTYDCMLTFGSYKIFACYDSFKDYDERKVAFYDIYDCDGNCINEGEPFYEMPSWKEVYEYYWLPTVRECEHSISRDLPKVEND